MILGALDYFRGTQSDRNWSGPFNGQQRRREVFNRLLDACDFQIFVETGTFRGVTTEFFAELKRGRVLSIEANRRNFGYASARLYRRSNVSLLLGDSAERLPLALALVGENMPGFVYLDAHWEAHLPLRDELCCIFSSGKPLVVMIDDFRVPDDPGYSFDDYGDAGSLQLAHIGDLVERFSLSVFFPSSGSKEETGAKRGMAILTTGSMAEQVVAVAGLRQWDTRVSAQ